MPEKPIPSKSRIVAHFPGFEPLDAEMHRQRYARSAAQSAAAFDFSMSVSELETDGPVSHFQVEAEAANWSARTQVHILGHDDIIRLLANDPFPVRLVRGYRALLRTTFEGALLRYFRVAWRFALFFLFPFLLMTCMIAGTFGLAILPAILGWNILHLAWSIPAAVLFFFMLLLPWSNRLHTMHLFDDWHVAARFARLDQPVYGERIDTYVEALRQILSKPADEYLVTAHSLGGTLATHVLGALIDRYPGFLEGKAISLVTLGGSGLQTSLLRCATALRQRIGTILQSPVTWIDMQCLTDPANFYRSKVARDNGFSALPEPVVITIRVRNMLTPERYRRIKRDFLRVHRQFVLGSDRRTHFDYALLTAGPFGAPDFARFSPASLPPLDQNGALVD